MISVLLSLALAQEAALPVLAASEVHLKKRAALHYPPAASEDHPDSVRCVAQVDLEPTGVPFQVEVSECPEVFHDSVRESVMKWRWSKPWFEEQNQRVRTSVGVTFVQDSPELAVLETRPEDEGLAHRFLHGVVGLGYLRSAGEGTDIPLARSTGVVRLRGVASVGRLAFGVDIDARTVHPSGGRTAVLVGAVPAMADPQLAVLSGLSVVQRSSLVSSWLGQDPVRVDVGIPLQIEAANTLGPARMHLVAGTWFTMAGWDYDGGLPWRGGWEVLLGVSVPAVFDGPDGSKQLGPRVDLGAREEFGFPVATVVLGFGT